MASKKNFREPDREKLTAHNAKERKLATQLKKVENMLQKEGLSWEKIFRHPVYIDAEALWRTHWNSCPQCGSTDTEVRNHDPIWHDGDVVCADCNSYVRAYDAG